MHPKYIKESDDDLDQAGEWNQRSGLVVGAHNASTPLCARLIKETEQRSVVIVIGKRRMKQLFGIELPFRSIQSTPQHDARIGLRSKHNAQTTIILLEYVVGTTGEHEYTDKF